MKEQIEKAVQKFGGWTAFETQIKGKSSIPVSFDGETHLCIAVKRFIRK